MPRFGRVGVMVFSAALAILLATGASAAPVYPLRVDPGTRTLVDAANTPFLVMGDTAWSLMVQLTDAEVQQYLDDRRARGINTIVVNLIEAHFGTMAPATIGGIQPFSSNLAPGIPDFSNPNPVYFAHAKWVIEQAQARGMLVMLAPMYLGFQGGDQGWYAQLKANGPARAAAFGTYVGQNFKQYPNIIWLQGGDTAPVDASTGVNAAAELAALVNAMRAAGATQLQTGHSARGRSSLDDYNEAWLGLDAVYTSCDDAQSKSRSEWGRSATMPFVHIEGIYENEPVGSPVAAECLLNQIYYPVLLGARGHVFGNRPMWLFAAGWQAALDSPGANYMKHASALLRSRDAWGLVPDVDRRIVIAGEGTVDTGDFAAAARTASRSSVLIYVPTARTLQVDTSQLAGSRTAARWYDPRTGQETAIGTFDNGAARSFTTPGGGPWLLVLDDPTVVPTQPVWHPFFAVDRLETPMVGDFDGDGKTDIITFTRQNPLAFGDVYVALSNGSKFVDKDGREGLSDKWHDWFAINTDETVVIGDYDGDGKDDIATWLGARTRQVYVARSTGTGMTQELVWLSSLGFDATDVLLSGDVNNDTREDLVLFARKRGEVWVALSQGTSFAPATLWHGFFAVSTYERPRVADVNGDGRSDIVTFATNSPTAFGDVYVALSNGSQFLDAAMKQDSSTKWHDWFAINPAEQVRIGDLDGDGKEDFFTFLPPPFAQCYTVQSLGDRMADNVLWPEAVAPGAGDVPFVGDANGDGRADIIVFAQDEGKVYVSLKP